MKKLALWVPPLIAIVLVMTWRSLFPTTPLAAEEKRVVKIDDPPTAECAKAMDESLERIQKGCEAVEGIRPALGSVRSSQASAPSTAGIDWPAMETRPRFVDRLLEGPPGVPASSLHRCSDLNPEDIPIPLELRQSIELAVQPYFDAILDLQKRSSAAMDQEFLSAESRGLGTSSVSAIGPDGHIGGNIEKSPEPSVTRLRVGQDRKQVSVTIGLQHMPQYRYYEGLQWYAVREAGTQILGIYSTLGFLPTNEADAMSREIVSWCSKYIE